MILRSGTDLRNQVSIPVKGKSGTRMSNGTSFKIGDYSLKMNNNSSKKNFRTTF